MSLRRPHRGDLAALALLVAGLAVALAIFTYHPADPPYNTLYPANDPPANFLGLSGATIASGLVNALGLAVYVLLAGWFLAVVFVFLRRRMVRWSLRLIGWLLLIPC